MSLSWFESHPRQLIFLRKSDCLGCAVLLCLVVCLTLLASFFLPSHLSLKHVYIQNCFVYLTAKIEECYTCDGFNIQFITFFQVYKQKEERIKKAESQVHELNVSIEYACTVLV